MYKHQKEQSRRVFDVSEKKQEGGLNEEEELQILMVAVKVDAWERGEEECWRFEVQLDAEDWLQVSLKWITGIKK